MFIIIITNIYERVNILLFKFEVIREYFYQVLRFVVKVAQFNLDFYFINKALNLGDRWC